MATALRNPRKRPNEKIIHSIGLLLDRQKGKEAEPRIAALRRQFPEDARLTAMYADALRYQGRHADAIASYRQARTQGLDDSDQLKLGLAASLSDREQWPETLALVDEVLAHDRKNLTALSLKGGALLHLGRLPEARACFEHMCKVAPGNADGYLGLTHLVTHTADSKLFDVIDRALKDPSLKPQARAHMLAAQGKAYLDLGDDDAAFAKYEQANRLMDESLPPIHSQIENRLRFTRNYYTRGLFDALSPSGLRGRPQIIVAGMSRAGKSLVESLFNGVEGVHPAGEDLTLGNYGAEMLRPWGGHTDAWLAAQTPASNARHAHEYAERMGHDDRIRVTTVPGNLWNLGLIGLWQPEVPIICCVRGMLDLGITGYFQQYAAPEAFRYSYNQHHLGREIACSERVMEHWAQVLPNPVYLVEYEALVRDPETVMGNLLRQLDLKRDRSWETIVGENARLLSDLSPVTSAGTPMPMTDRFIGIGERFRSRLEPLIEGYKTVAQEFPRREHPAALQVPLAEKLYDGDADGDADPSEGVDFNWQIGGRLMVLDNGGQLLRGTNVESLLQLDAFGLVAFDPAGDIKLTEAQRQDSKLQYVPQAVLGDGEAGQLHCCLDPAFNATLVPRATGDLPAHLQQPAREIAKLPVNTLRLDAIDGLDRLDWLLLDARHDNAAILEHGARALERTLVIQARILFQPVYQRQPSLDELCHWAARHGFVFHCLFAPHLGQAMPVRADLPRQPDGSRLDEASALFLPNAERMAALDDPTRLKLAFLLDTIYHVHDLAYALLRQVGETLGDNYLKARGYFNRHRNGPPTSEIVAMRRAFTLGNLYEPQGKLAFWQRQYPNVARIHALRAVMLTGFGQYNDAIASANRAAQCDVEDLGVRLAAIETLLAAGIWWEALTGLAPLAARFPAHPRVALLRAEALAVNPVAEPADMQQALADLEAAALGDDVVVQVRRLSAKARLEGKLGQGDVALATHSEAAMALGTDFAGPLRARVAFDRAHTELAAGDIDAACRSFWQACDTHPYSPLTRAAQRRLMENLPACRDPELRALAPLQREILGIWARYADEKLKYTFGDFGLPYQGFEPLMLTGGRPAMQRLGVYQLEQYLPEGARALDIGCNHGYLLMGLAPRLSYGLGFDISEACVDVGNAVARHLGHAHVHLTTQPFDQFECKKRFDLVIACAVHHWIGEPLEQFGEKLASYCKKDGIVLLESQGQRNTRVTESDFDAKVATMAGSNFELASRGDLCDDGFNYRKFSVLRRI